MKRHVVAVVATVMMIASACGSGDTTIDWDDVAEIGGPVVENASEIVATDDYRLLVGDSTPRNAPPSFRCVQLVVGGMGIGCIEVDRDDGSTGGHRATVKSGGQRVIWSGNTTSGEPQSVVDHYVVWSSLEPDGRRIEPIEASDTTNLIWVMQPGEAPWGFQAIAGNGVLLETRSLVGLPES